MAAVPTNRELRNPADGPPVGNPDSGALLIPQGMPLDVHGLAIQSEAPIPFEPAPGVVVGTITFTEPQAAARFIVTAAGRVRSDTTTVPGPTVTLRLQSRVTDAFGTPEAAWTDEATASVEIPGSNPPGRYPQRFTVTMGSRTGTLLRVPPGAQQIEFRLSASSSSTLEHWNTSGFGGYLFGIAAL